MADETVALTSQQILDAATALAKRLCDDPIVSDDIKELATVVRLLADGQVIHEAAIQKLAARPSGRSVTNVVSYGK